MLALTLLTMLLSGCATAVTDPRLCPTIQSYTRDQLNAMADELQHAGPALRRMSVDYMKLRDKVRACRGGK